MPGVQRDGTFDELDSRITPVPLMQKHPKEVHSVGVIGRCFENTAVEGFSVRELG